LPSIVGWPVAETDFTPTAVERGILTAILDTHKDLRQYGAKLTACTIASDAMASLHDKDIVVSLEGPDGVNKVAVKFTPEVL